MQRAVELAQKTGCEVELLHICSRPTGVPVMETFDATDERLRDEATQIAEIAARLAEDGVTVRHDTRSDGPRSEAILRKIEEAKPDVVLKQSRGHDFVIGLLSNPDWDLIRRSPSPLWFVHEKASGPINAMITALSVGAEPDAEDELPNRDIQSFRFAESLARQYAATNYLVHAYNAPRGLRYASHIPDVGAAAYPTVQPMSMERVKQRIAEQHGEALRNFADRCGVNPENIRLAEGSARDVLPEAARRLGADVIVLSARDLTRWERVAGRVTAEPVLATSPCDVVVVKDAGSPPVPAQSVAVGEPAVDVERATIDPSATFDSPRAVAKTTQLSPGLRRRILSIWEEDVRILMTDENEGGAANANRAELLRAIHEARESLVTDKRRGSATITALRQ